jgi:hypothetical protein
MTPLLNITGVAATTFHQSMFLRITVSASFTEMITAMHTTTTSDPPA